MKFVAFLLAACAFVFADDLSDCRCPAGYTPTREDDGHVSCYGDLVRAIQPCNLLQTPKCVCSGDVNGITTDDTGTWCGKYRQGKLLRRWDCENRKDWSQFYADHPNAKP